jgi:serine/threonine protein kinase
MQKVKIRIKTDNKPTYFESPKQKRENKFKTSLKSFIPEVKSSEIQKKSDPVNTVYGTSCEGVCRGMNVIINEFKELSDSEYFSQQAKILAHLRHPNIVLLLGVCTEHGYNAILTEPVGSNLNSIVFSTTTHVTLYQKLKYAKDISQGLNWLHDSSPPIIHSNIKLEHIVLDQSDNSLAKVCLDGIFVMFF